MRGAGAGGQAREVVAACRGAGALAIINDRVDVALAAGADGVHVGQVRGPPSPLPPLPTLRLPATFICQTCQYDLMLFQ